MTFDDPREIALRTILEYSRRDAYLNVLLRASLKKSKLNLKDRAFVTELVLGTVRMKLNLDYAISCASSRPTSQIDDEILWILRLQTYQLLYMDVPDYAVCDTGVELARHFCKESAASFVNAVLRNFIRLGNVEYPNPDDDPVSYIELFLSHPRWIAELLIREFGVSRAISICRANNEPRAVSLRANLRRATREELAFELEKKGAEVEFSRIVPEGLLVKKIGDIAKLDSYLRGLFGIQDEGSILVGHITAPEKGMEVLDLCAAPGGKANHMSELMGNEGRILAIDVNSSRLNLIKKEAGRLGNTIIETVEMDARNVSKGISQKFDRVLLDAPCSGLGTLSRRPDLRWRKKLEDIEKLVGLQKELICEAAKMVKPSGFLAYSTCTLSKAENEDVANWFLENDGEFEPVIGDERFISDGKFFRVFPDEHGCDGMFIAVLKRASWK